jgi:hypothetical protein
LGSFLQFFSGGFNQWGGGWSSGMKNFVGQEASVWVVLNLLGSFLLFLGCQGLSTGWVW